MSRSTQASYQEEEMDGSEFDENFVIKVVKNCPKNRADTERVLLIDGDSLLWMCTYNPDRKEDLTDEEMEEDFNECCHRLREKIAEITISVEEWYSVVGTMIFVGGKDNFRYKIFPEYKANRKSEKPVNFNAVKKYMVDELGAIEAHGAEADDYIYEAWKLANGNSIVASIDKDLKSFCHGVIYDYRSYDDVLGEFKFITEKQAKYLFHHQLITGDAGDGVNLTPKIGKKYADGAIHEDMTDEEYEQAVFAAYLKAWGDVDVAKEKMELCKKLLGLFCQSEIKSLNL